LSEVNLYSILNAAWTSQAAFSFIERYDLDGLPAEVRLDVDVLRRLRNALSASQRKVCFDDAQSILRHEQLSNTDVLMLLRYLWICDEVKLLERHVSQILRIQALSNENFDLPLMITSTALLKHADLEINPLLINGAISFAEFIMSSIFSDNGRDEISWLRKLSELS
jgi:hypothetical protein